jgi:Cu(I)/Ag(I) efflux system periplasmic protein CusF
MIRFAVPLVASLLVAGTALAQHHHHAMPQHSSSHANDATATDGVVQKIDKDAGKITLKHGEIKNIGMPPMTMTFPVKDPVFLDKVKPGEKVTFFVQQTGSGAMMVTAIEKAN